MWHESKEDIYLSGWEQGCDTIVNIVFTLFIHVSIYLFI